MSPENQLILPKTVKKISEGSFFKEKCGSGRWNRISLKSYNSGFTCRSQKRFSLFYSSSKALSNDISLTLKLWTAFNPFWWRQPLWRHSLTFCVKQKLTITWLTIVVYLVSLVEKWKEMWKISKFSLNKPFEGWFGPAVKWQWMKKLDRGKQRPAMPWNVLDEHDDSQALETCTTVIWIGRLRNIKQMKC